jgi:outer membrane protein TolC
MTMLVRTLCLVAALLPWRVFAEPGLSLEQAVEIALARNERAASAEAGLRVADAGVARTRAYYYPTLSFSAGFTQRPYQVTRNIGGEEVVIQNSANANGTLLAQMPLYDAAAKSRRKQAEAEQAVTRADAEEMRRALMTDVATAYFNALGQSQVLVAATSRRDLAKERHTAAQARLSAGLVRSNDVTQAELALAQAELEVTRAQGNLDLSYLQLGYLLDQEVKGPLLAPESFLSAANTPQRAEDLLASSGGRPDVDASQKRATAARLSAQEPGQRFWPSLWLSAQVRGNNNPGLSGRYDDEFVGLSATWSIYDAQRAAEEDLLSASAERAALEAKLRERAASLEVRSALVALASVQAGQVHAQAAREVAAKNAQEAASLYEKGLETAINVASADATLFEAEVELVRQRYGLALSFLELRRAAGLDPVRVEAP